MTAANHDSSASSSTVYLGHLQVALSYIFLCPFLPFPFLPSLLPGLGGVGVGMLPVKAKFHESSFLKTSL